MSGVARRAQPKRSAPWPGQFRRGCSQDKPRLYGTSATSATEAANETEQVTASLFKFITATFIVLGKTIDQYLYLILKEQKFTA